MRAAMTAQRHSLLRVVALIGVCAVLAAAVGWQAASAAPREAVVLNNEGVKAINTGNCQLAIVKLEQAWKLDSNYQLAKENLAIAYNNYGLQLQKSPKEAIKQFHKALYFEPKYATTAENLDGIITVMHKNPKAFEDRVALADEALREHEDIGALIEYRQALAIREDSSVRAKLNAVSRRVELNHRAVASGNSSSNTAADVDFGPYMAELQRSIKRAWFPPKGDKSKRVVVVFKVHSDGRASDVKVEKSSGVATADQAALKGIENAAPFRQLPEGAPAEVDIQYTFDYNVFPDERMASTATDTRVSQDNTARRSGNGHTMWPSVIATGIQVAWLIAALASIVVGLRGMALRDNAKLDKSKIILNVGVFAVLIWIVTVLLFRLHP